MSSRAPAYLLIVEDDAAVRESLCAVLVDEGHVAVACSNGQDALLYLRDHPPPRLILLDLMMPVLDGEGFRAAQLADPQLADIPTVVMSATNDGRHRATRLRAHGYLQKPIDLDSLLALLDSGTPTP
jgi:CheY-like chemotaxis protein